MSGNTGFKPREICGVLNISQTTFQYWRKHLYPNEQESYYSGYDVFGFFLIKEIIENGEIPVQKLAKVNAKKIFDHCDTSELDSLVDETLVIDLRANSLEFFKKKSEWSNKSWAILHIDLGPLYREYTQYFMSFGKKH